MEPMIKPLTGRSNDPRRVLYNQAVARLEEARSEGRAWRMRNRRDQQQRKRALRWGGAARYGEDWSGRATTLVSFRGRGLNYYGKA